MKALEASILGGDYSCVPANLYELNILVIDDNIDLLEIISSFLRKRGIGSDIANSGQEGLRKYLAFSEKYNVILLDIQMPGLNGYEVLNSIRKAMPNSTRRPQVIAMSGSIINMEDTDFDFFIQKPFKYSDLFALVLLAAKCTDIMNNTQKCN